MQPLPRGEQGEANGTKNRSGLGAARKGEALRTRRDRFFVKCARAQPLAF